MDLVRHQVKTLSGDQIGNWVGGKIFWSLSMALWKLWLNWSVQMSTKKGPQQSPNLLPEKKSCQTKINRYSGHSLGPATKHRDKFQSLGSPLGIKSRH